MPTILCDHNIEGQLRTLASFWTSEEWLPLWQSLKGGFVTLDELGVAENAPDSEIWSLCQQRGMILLTGNRNADGDDSLEMTMRRLCRPDSLPVLTIADPERVMSDRAYAERVAVQVLDVFLDLERLRGTRRLFIP